MLMFVVVSSVFVLLLLVAYACYVADGRDLSSASRTHNHEDAVGLKDLLSHRL